jgi:hypothetical protein
MDSMLIVIAASQHTSIDVYAYADWRSKIPVNWGDGGLR